MRAMPATIRDLQHLFPNRKINQYSTGPLTAQGENYGSIILWLNIEFSDEMSKEYNFVAKLIPRNKFICKMFNSDVTFRNETAFYQHIVPILDSFTIKESCFPKFIAGRLSLQHSQTKVGQDAVLILENLKVKGYKIVDRMVGFDLHSSKISMQVLARFHALSVVMRMNQFEQFQNFAKEYLQYYKQAECSPNWAQQLIERYAKLCQSFIEPDKLTTILNRSHGVMVRGKNLIVPQRDDIFNAIIHSDDWVNNFMIKYDERSYPISSKMVDFQLYEYGSFTRDIIFLLLTSVQIDVVEQHYDDLIDIYLNEFLSILREANCDPTIIQQYTVEAFEREMKSIAADYEFFHCLMMLPPMYAEEKFVKAVEEINEDSISDEAPMSEKYTERAHFIVRFFMKKGWLE